MAKSIRSKRKRAMRAIKRERYAKKELDRLVNMLKKAKDNEENQMEIDSLVTVTDSKTVLENQKKEENSQESEEMEHNQKRVFNKKTMRDQYGNYPIWLSSKKKKALIKVNQKRKSKKKGNK